MDNSEFQKTLKERFDEIENEFELIDDFLSVVKSQEGNLEKVRICFKAFRDSVGSVNKYHTLTNEILTTTDIGSLNLDLEKDIISMYDLLYDKNTISEEELRSKILGMLDYLDNTYSMVEYFLKIVKTQRGNFKNIQACFKAMGEYCKGENYFDQMLSSIAIRIDAEDLEIDKHVDGIFDLFDQ